MTALSAPPPPSLTARPWPILAGAGLVAALLLIAIARRLASGAPVAVAGVSPWLVLHLATVIPALPLGAYILLRRKGDRLHRRLGRIWAGLMLFTALVSFGVQTYGHLSPIHLLSLLVLVMVPRGVWMAMRGRFETHRRIMRNVFLFGLVGAGLFVFLPGRLLGGWLLHG